MATTEAECVAALREAAEILGESPTKATYEDLGLTPSAATILRVFGRWNAAKERAGLETAPSTGTRVQPKPAEVAIPDGESWADLTQDQRWHYRNVAWNTERTLRRRARTRAWVYERKRRSGGCSNCSETDPACLDYHHPDPGEKTMAVNEMVAYGYARERILAALEACELLCANCHAREHRSLLADGTRRGPPTVRSSAGKPRTREAIRRWTRRYRAREGCRDCALADPSCLQFHHLDEASKAAGVGRLVSDGGSFEEVHREVEKSAVLCANCHRKAHRSPPDVP